MSTSPFHTPATSNLEKPKEDVERIRDIIFGGQMREYEARFQMMEQGFRSDVAAMKSELVEMRSQFAAKKEEMESKVEEVKEELRRDLHLAREELGREMSERRKALSELTAQTKDGFGNVEAVLKGANTRLMEAERRYQEGMIEKTQFIHEEMQASVKNLTSYLDQQTRDLRESKLDRADLSKALEFVAGGLATKAPQTGML